MTVIRALKRELCLPGVPIWNSCTCSPRVDIDTAGVTLVFLLWGPKIHRQLIQFSPYMSCEVVDVIVDMFLPH